MDLVNALDKAASAVPSQRQTGEKELKSLEKEQGFHAALLSVYINDEWPTSSRSLAIIYLKNAVERNWRKSNVFSNEEKNLLRERLFQCIMISATTSSKQMSKQLAVIIATIARIDFPRFWPGLLESLNRIVLESAEKGALPDLNAALEVVHQTLKKLASARIGQARVIINEFSVTQIELYWRIFLNFDCYAALKIVGTLIYSGNDRAHRFEASKRVFHELSTALLPSSRYVYRVGKIFCRLIENNPLAFCGFAQDAANVTRFYCDFLNSRPEMGPIVQAMCIIRDTTRILKTQDSSEMALPLNLRPRDDQDRSDLRSAYETCYTVFESSNLNALTYTLIQFFFQMTGEDVDMWREDPDEFVIEESKQNADFSVVLCAEMLFAHLLKTWPDIVAPQSKRLIEEAVSSGQELAIEAALRALEFGASTFSQSFAIEPIINLLASHESPLVRRRLCHVISGWIPVKAGDTTLQVLAFKLVKSILENPNWDTVVRLGSLDLVRVCCDDIDFSVDCFNSAGDVIFDQIYRFLQNSSQSTELKLHVLNVLGAVIEGIGLNLSDSNIQQVLQILPALWGAEVEHSNHHLIQGSVLQALAHLVGACGSRCQPCFAVAVPLCQISTDPAQPISSYLMEDALGLWRALVSNSPQEDTGMVFLIERLITLIESRTEYLGTLLSILEGYLLLDYRVILPFAEKLLGLFSIFLGDGCALDEALLILLCVEVLCIASFKYEGHFHQITSVMQQTGLQQWMVGRIVQAGQPWSDTTGMDVFIQAGKCMNVLSLIEIATQGRSLTEELELVLTSWIFLSNSVADPRDRKLACMGFTSLLLANPEMFNKFSNDIVQYLSLTIEEVPDPVGADSFVGRYSTENEETLTSEEKRRNQMRSEEFAVTTQLQVFVAQVCIELKQRGSPQMFEVCAQMGILPA